MKHGAYFIIILSFSCLFTLGSIFNDIAVKSNGGRMPSSCFLVDTTTHFYYDNKSLINASYFADNYYLESIFICYSIGDILIYPSFFIIIGTTIFYWFALLIIILRGKKND